jgi:CO/xanthine dehydrogenase FAD-binding subunit
MKALKIIKPSSISEAYEILHSQKKASLIAGGLFMRLQKKTFPLLIDLEPLNLDYIKPIKDGYIIGAMTPLRSFEEGQVPNALKTAVKQISGVGVRNMATVGGSICGKYPFSDINSALLALDAYLVFYKRGKMSMRDFYKKGLDEKDILVEVYIKKPKDSVTKYYKKVYTDFSLVNVAYADGDFVIGARPGKALVVENISEVTPDNILDGINFKDDYRASGDYRKALAKALIEDIIKERGTYGS